MAMIEGIGIAMTRFSAEQFNPGTLNDTKTVTEQLQSLSFQRSWGTCGGQAV